MRMECSVYFCGTELAVRNWIPNQKFVHTIGMKIFNLQKTNKDDSIDSRKFFWQTFVVRGKIFLPCEQLLGIVIYNTFLGHQQIG